MRCATYIAAKRFLSNLEIHFKSIQLGTLDRSQDIFSHFHISFPVVRLLAFQSLGADLDSGRVTRRIPVLKTADQYDVLKVV